MAQTAANVRVPSAGGVRVAPVGTAVPTDLTTAYAAAWKELGYLNEDGIVESANQDTTEIRAWQGSTIVRRVISSAETQFSFTCLETNTEVLRLFYPGSTFVTATGVTTLTVKVPTADPRAFAFDLIDGTIRERVFVPRGEIADRGDISYTADGARQYEFTMSCYPASDGTVMVRLTDDPAVVGP